MVIRAATIEDLPHLLEIYNEVVRSSAATFDLEEQTLEQRAQWFAHYGGRYPLIVGEVDGQVAGYASLSVFRTKPAHAGTAEASVYVDSGCQRRGIGKALMKDLLRRAAELGYHVVVAGITGGNEASVRLHLELGFTYVGRFREVGRKFGQWQDVDFYQLVLG